MHTLEACYREATREAVKKFTILDSMARNHVVGTSGSHIPNQKEGKNMLKRYITTRILTFAGFAVAIAMMAAMGSVPAAAKDKPLLSKSELKHLITTASTKADHERVAQYFDAEASRYEAEAKEHGELSEYYHKTPDPTLSKHPSSPGSFAHCDALSKSLQQAAVNARQLAADHRKMSEGAK